MKISPITFSFQNSAVRGFAHALLAISFVALASNRVLAVTNDPWDPSGNAIDAGGTWDTTGADWDVAPYVWNNASGYTAVFGFGAPGPYTVTLGVPIVAGGVTFNAGSNYTIAGSGANTLTLNAGSVITANAASSTIGAAIAGTTVSVAGTGTLTLSGANTFAATPPTTAGASSTASLSIGSGSHVLLGSATTLQNEVVSVVSPASSALIFQTGLGGVFTIGGLQTGTGGITLADNATPTPNAITLVLGNQGDVATLGLSNESAATAGVNPLSTYGGVLSGAGGNLIKGGNYVAVASQSSGGSLQTTNPFAYTNSIYTAGTQVLTANSTYTGSTSVTAGTLQLAGNTTAALSGTSGLSVTGSGIFIDGDTTTAANNNAVASRVNSSAANGLTLGGTGGGGTFVLALGTTGDSQSFSSLKLGAGGNEITAQNAGTGTLTFSGAAGSVYTAGAHSTVNFGSDTGTAVSGFTPQFTNAATGSSVSGSGVSAILNGATLNGTTFVGAAAGTLAAPTYVTTTTGGNTASTYAGANMDVTASTGVMNAVFTSGANAVNSIRFNTGTAYTVTLATGTNYVTSGDILDGAGSTVTGSTITGGTLTSGTQDLQVFDYNEQGGLSGSGTSAANPRAGTGAAGLTISSIIANNSNGAVAVDVSGPAITYLSAANTYTGGTYLDGGRLYINTDSSLGSTVSEAGIFAENGFNTVTTTTSFSTGRAITINSGATLQLTTNGNTLTYTGALSGAGELQIGFVSDGSLVNFTGTANSGFTGNYSINGIIRGVDGTNLSSNANIILAGRSGFDTGVVESNGTFSRSIGTGPGQIQWASDTGYGSGGFAANGGNLTVNLGGAGAALSYATASNATGFVTSNAISPQLLVLQDQNSGANTLNFQNGLVLAPGTATNYIEVGGTNSLTDAATISGLITGTSANSNLLFYNTTGYLILSNANNSYLGATNLYYDTGSLSVSTLANGGLNSNIGASSNAAGNLVIADGATLVYTGGTTSTDRLFTIGSAFAGATNAAVISSSGTGALTFSNTGAIAFGSTNAANASLTLTGTYTGASNVFAPILGNISGFTTSLTKSGAGTWDLTGANTYTGGTTISAGTLQIGNATALGGSAGAVIETSGAVLDLNGQTVTNTNPLTLSGTGLSNGGALINSSTTAATYGGPITLGSTSSIVATNGNITLSNGTTITGAGFGLTLGGAANGSVAAAIGTTTGSLTKNGAGTWTLSGNDTFTGGVTINGGILQLGNAGALNSTAGSQNAVAFGSGSTGTLALAGNSVTVANLSTNATPGTTFVENADGSSVANATLTVGNSTNVSGTYAGIIQDGTGGGTLALAKAGTGTLTLSGANTYTGGTSVSAGILQVANATALGASSGAVSVTSGAVLDLDGTTMTTTNALTLNGTGISSGGALINSSATSATYAGPITVGTGSGAGSSVSPFTTSIVANNGALVTTGAISTSSTSGNYTLTLGGSGTAGNDLQSTLTDSGGFGLVVSKAGAGTWTLGGSGTYSDARGGIAISGGTLNFGSATEAPSFTTTNAPASGGGIGAELYITGGNFNMVNGTLSLSGGASSGLFGLYDIGTGNINVSGGTLIVNPATNSGQGIILGTNTYTQTGGTVSTNGIIELANASAALVTTVNLSAGSLTTTSGNASDATDLAVRGTTTFTLSGTGTFTTPVLNMTTSQLSSGTATSTFNLNGGTLVVGTIIKGTGGPSGTQTFNFNGGTLKSSASSTTFLTGLTAANVRNGGALINTNGFNDTIGQALVHSTIGGDNAIDGGLTKLGSGTLTLTGADTYTGGTTISAGTLVANNASALGSTSGALAINGGGILDIDNISQTVGATTLGTAATSTGSTIQSTGGTGTLTTSGVTVNGTGNIIASSAIVTGAISQSASSGLTVNGTGGTDALANLATLNGTGTLSTITLAGNNTVSSAGTLMTSGITVSGTGNLIGTGTVLGAITQTGSSALTVSGTAGSDALNTAATLAGSGSGSVTTVTLAGSNVLSGTLGTTGITVSGTGNSITGTVSGPITFSGTSALKVAGTASGTVAVTSGATLSGTGTTGAVTMSSGGNINLQDSTIGTLSVGGLTTTGGTATFEIGVNTVNSIDKIADASNGTLSIGSGSTITIVNLGGGTTGQTLAVGSYTLLTYGGTTSGASLSNFSLSSSTLDGDTLSLSTATPGQLILNVAAAIVDTGSDYFNGTSGNLNLAASYDNGLSTGTATTSNPSATSNLFFSASRNTVPLTTGTVTSNLAVNSVNFGVGGTTSTFTVNGTNTLTINAATINGNTAPNGINIATGGGSATINAPIALGANQTWTPTDASSTLTVNGVVSGAFKLTTAGAGTTILASANTYTGGTEVSSGTLVANGGTATRTGGTTGFVTGASGSATGTGAVLIDSGAKLAGTGVIAPGLNNGITVATGGTLVSGVAPASGTVAGNGLTLDNTTSQTTILNIQNNATLSFYLGSGATQATYNFANPATQSSYLTVLGTTTGEIAFGMGDTINLTDLTGNFSLQLLSSTPYLLIQAGGGDSLADNNLYAGLVTSGGGSSISNNLQNGWVTNLTLSGLSATAYPNERLYLYDGDLEVVPEPSTWALMIGGLALLVVWQRRRSKNV